MDGRSRSHGASFPSGWVCSLAGSDGRKPLTAADLSTFLGLARGRGPRARMSRWLGRVAALGAGPVHSVAALGWTRVRAIQGVAGICCSWPVVLGTKNPAQGGSVRDTGGRRSSGHQQRQAPLGRARKAVSPHRAQVKSWVRIPCPWKGICFCMECLLVNDARNTEKRWASKEKGGLVRPGLQHKAWRGPCQGGQP